MEAARSTLDKGYSFEYRLFGTGRHEVGYAFVPGFYQRWGPDGSLP